MEGIKREKPGIELETQPSYSDKKATTEEKKESKIAPIETSETVDSFLSSKTVQMKLSEISKTDLPFFFGLKSVDRNFVSKEPLTLASEIIPDDDALLSFSFDKKSVIHDRFLSNPSQDIVIFVIKSSALQIERVGTIRDIGNLSVSSKPYVSSILAINNPAFSESKDLTVDVAAIFHSGIFVKRDRDLAAKILQKIGNREEINNALTGALLVSCSDENSVALTRAFLELGANPNGINEAGYTTLDKAFRGGGTGNLKTLETLIDFGATVGAPIGMLEGSFWDMLRERAQTVPELFKKEIMNITRKKLKEEQKSQIALPIGNTEIKL